MNNAELYIVNYSHTIGLQVNDKGQRNCAKHTKKAQDTRSRSSPPCGSHPAADQRSKKNRSRCSQNGRDLQLHSSQTKIQQQGGEEQISAAIPKTDAEKDKKGDLPVPLLRGFTDSNRVEERSPLPSPLPSAPVMCDKFSNPPWKEPPYGMHPPPPPPPAPRKERRRKDAQNGATRKTSFNQNPIDPGQGGFQQQQPSCPCAAPSDVVDGWTNFGAEGTAQTSDQFAARPPCNSCPSSSGSAASDPCGNSDCPPPPEKPKKFKKRPMKPFVTTDQLRQKLYGYIENKPDKVGVLKPFRGYRDDIVREMVCCPDKQVLNPPDPCPSPPPEDECANWRIQAQAMIDAEEARKTMAEVKCYKDLLPQDLCPDEQVNYMKCMGASQNAICAFRDMQAKDKECGGSCGPPPPPPDPCGASSGSAPQQPRPKQPCSGGPPKGPSPCRPSPCGQKPSPPSTSGSDNCKCDSDSASCGPLDMDAGPPAPANELNAILDYCRQRKAEADAGSSCSASVSAVPSCSSSPDGNENGSGRWEPDRKLRCEEVVERTLEDEEEEQEIYNMHPMFGGPDPPPPRTMKEEMRLYREHLANIRRRYFGSMVKKIDDVESITPDIVAAMVYSEEMGMKMKGAPMRVYDYLYPEVPSQPVMSIGHVTSNLPRGLDDIVVPLVPPMTLESKDFPGLEDPAMLDHPRIIQVPPDMKLAEEPVASDTMPPGDICELVTGHTVENMTSIFFPEYADMGLDDDEEGDVSPEDEGFNIMLSVSVPPHYSKVQMRGSQPPNWFPGYYLALPNKKDVKIEDNIGNLLEKVWEEVQPEFVQPPGGAIVIGE